MPVWPRCGRYTALVVASGAEPKSTRQFLAAVREAASCLREPDRLKTLDLNGIVRGTLSAERVSRR
jgi:hypothetical protein